ncbi:MAG TPA: MBOAT family protein [Sedimentisphaerales bacterium]|nr:MBOAT family protein [Sedimentisphaerales bacterium]
MLQIVLLLAASYIFYMSWNPTFILLILFSTVNDYVAGLGIAGSKTRRARVCWLLMSCFTNLGLLAVFKYLGFFVASVNQVWLAWYGGSAVLPAVALTLPVGISFFTFQSMSYTIDLFRGEIKPERSFMRFALYVAFFPQLVAGPILRSKEFIPQLRSVVELRAENLLQGCNQFLVGLVKKVIIADNIAPLVNQIFAAPQGSPSAAIWLGALAFGIQIYGDFSGYSDMAIGSARMLGFHIPRNFNFPYAARSITDFWRRWHISLSTWLRDYLYIPLGGNRKGRTATYRNLFVTMALGGLWHGAGLNFIVWGMYHGALLAVERSVGFGRQKEGVRSARPASFWARGKTLVVWLLIQYLVFLGWVIFRVHNWSDLTYCVRKYVFFDFNFDPGAMGLSGTNPFVTVGIILVFVLLHAISYRSNGLIHHLNRLRGFQLGLVWMVVLLCLMFLWPTGRTAFIYFQF